MRRVLILLAVVLASCDRATDSNMDASTSTVGTVAVAVNLGRVGVLARSLRIDPAKLILRFTSPLSSTIADTIVLSGSGLVSKAYSLPSQQSWTLQATGLDRLDSVVYSGSANFAVLAGKTTSVALSLDALFSSLRANFPVRDSMTRFVLSVDGVVWGDSTVAKKARVGDTIKIERDYLSASAAGALHAIALRIYGQPWGTDTLLYALDTTARIFSGANQGMTFMARWVGPAAPPSGQAALAVTLGTAGQVVLAVTYQDATTPSDYGIPWAQVNYGALLDVRDGKTYRTVNIRGQTWMAQNLDYGGNGTIGTCANDSCAKFGRLYKWSEAMDISGVYDTSVWLGSDFMHQGICPSGWHVPSETDWGTLLGNVPASSGMLKSTIGWNPSGPLPNDAYGFRAIPTIGNDFTSFWTANDPSGVANFATIVWFTYSNGFAQFPTGNTKVDGTVLRCIGD